MNVVREFLGHRGYECQPEFNLKQLVGVPVRVDILCKKGKEIAIIEVRSGIIHASVIAQLAYLRTFTELANAQLYLAVPKKTKFSGFLWALLKQSSIRVIRVGGRRNDVTIENPRFFPSLSLERRSNLQQITSFIPRRSIPPFLLEKLHFSRVSYASELNEFVEQYGDVKNSDDEDEIVLKYLEKLWLKKYGKRLSVKVFSNFKDFEPILRNIRGYRDHFIHPFQVFLLGSLVIDRNYDLFTRMIQARMPNIEIDTPEFAWLLASTFHDIGYPIQMFKDFTGKFFSDFLHTEKVGVVVDFKNVLLDGETLNFVDQLASLYDFCNSDEGSEQWIFNSRCVINTKIRERLLKSLVNDQNHGVLSSLTLLKKIAQEDFAKNNVEYIRGRFSTDVFPASLAIALHDLIAQEESRETFRVGFNGFPFTVLLIYCDTVQEWARDAPKSVSAEFLDFQVNRDSVTTAISLKNRAELEKKMCDTNTVFGRLVSSELGFSCRLVCEEDGAEHVERILHN